MQVAPKEVPGSLPGDTKAMPLLRKHQVQERRFHQVIRYVVRPDHTGLVMFTLASVMCVNCYCVPLQDTKSRPPRSHGGHREGSKTGGGTSQYSSRGRITAESHHHSSSRHRSGGSGSADGGGNSSTGTRSESRILSSNRFEKLEIDPEYETSNASVGLSMSRENLSKSSSTTSISPSDSGSLMTSSSSFSSRGSEDKRPAKERNSRNGGRGSFRGKGSAKLEFAENSNSSGSLKDDKNIVRGDDGGQKKKFKQIKFDLSSKVESENVCPTLPGDDSAFFSESLERANSDEVNSAGDGADARSVGQMEADVERIVYDRVCLMIVSCMVLFILLHRTFC